jgi:hypothetical protein
MLSFPLSEEYVVDVLHQVHPNINYIDSEAVLYILAFVTPFYDKFVELNDLVAIKTFFEEKTNIDEDKISTLNQSIVFATKEYDACPEEDRKLEQFIYGVIYYLISDILTVAGDELLKYNNIEYPQELIDIPVSSDDVFLGIFNDNELRYLIFTIMPSPIILDQIDQPISYDRNVTDTRCINVIRTFDQYLFGVYNDNTYNELSNMIKEQYSLTEFQNPISYTLTENIKLNDWNLNAPRFYIISLYDNKLIDWRTPLSYKL